MWLGACTLLGGCTTTQIALHPSPKQAQRQIAAAVTAPVPPPPTNTPRSNPSGVTPAVATSPASSSPRPPATEQVVAAKAEAQRDQRPGAPRAGGPEHVADPDLPPSPSQLQTPPTGPTQPITLEQVIDAIYQAYPLLRVALLERNVAAGENVAAQGEFDLKLKAESANTPEGYYQTYRHSAGFEQPLYSGGQVFGGYRIGRGSFEPWYLERQTNEGGEFKLGLAVPLWQNRTIDERRARLWITAYGRNLVEPEIRAQLLIFIRDGSIAYWEWVGAGRQYHYAEQLLALAQNRNEQLRRQVEQGRRPEADLTDNERLIVGRQVKLLDTLRKLQTTAAKLSLYLRMPDGSPFVPGPELLPDRFPEPTPVNRELLAADIAFAQSRRPELASLDIVRQMLYVELCQAQNLTQPELDAMLVNSKDVGGPTSSKQDKSPYELEAGVSFAVPLQRRKALGKISAIEAKMAQLNAKRQFTADKIAVEVQAAVIALDTAYQAIGQAREAVRLNEEMERFELIRLEQGDSDFLRLNLREQATFDARVAEVEALTRYAEALSEYRAAVAADLPEF